MFKQLSGILFVMNHIMSHERALRVIWRAQGDNYANHCAHLLMFEWRSVHIFSPELETKTGLPKAFKIIVIISGCSFIQLLCKTSQIHYQSPPSFSESHPLP